MKKDLLLKLADLLDKIPDEKFDFGTWLDGDPALLQDMEQCGTVACALGWATTIPECGLVMAGDVVRTKDRVETDFFSTGHYEWGASAGARAFGLTQKQAEDMFLNGPFGPSRADVARYIRHVVDSNE